VIPTLTLAALLVPAAPAGDFDAAAHLRAIKPACEVVPDYELSQVALLTVDAPPAIVTGLSGLLIDAAGVRVNGELIPLADGVQGRIEVALVEQRAEREAFGDGALFGGSLAAAMGGGYTFSGWERLLIAPDAPAALVAAAFAALHAEGYTEVSFAARSSYRDALPEPPGGAEMEAFLAGRPADAVSMQGYFADALAAATAGCQPILDAYSSVGSVEVHLRCAALMDNLAPAFARCPGSDAAMVAGLVHLMNVPEVWLTQLSVSPDPAAPPVTYAAGETWAQLGPRVFAAGSGPLWLAAR
jgi:hypothetical protein